MCRQTGLEKEQFETVTESGNNRKIKSIVATDIYEEKYKIAKTINFAVPMLLNRLTYTTQCEM